MALLLGPCWPCMSGPGMSLPTRLPPQWVTLVMACSEILQAGLPPSAVHPKHVGGLSTPHQNGKLAIRSCQLWQVAQAVARPENKLLAQQSQTGPATRICCDAAPAAHLPRAGSAASAGTHLNMQASPSAAQCVAE